MRKVIIIPNKISMLDSISCDGWILGIDGLSTNLPMYVTLEQCINIIENSKNEIFVSLNKNMHNADLQNLKKVLLALNDYKVKVLFYDISVVNIKKELGLSIELVWDQEHMTTNALAANYWYKHGANYAYLSSEITSEEIKTIKNNYKGKILVNMFGYIPMFTSKRHLIKNYLNFFNINDNSKKHYIYKEGNNYPIVDDKRGTTVYSSYILNGMKHIVELDIDYIVLNSFEIDDSIFRMIVEMYKNVNKENVLNYNKQIEEKLHNVSTGFLDIETVYMVKNDEK